MIRAGKRHVHFKHALIQEAAYQSLLRSTRQQHHQRIAQVLAAQFPETVATQPALLAHHYTEAGLHAQAVPYWQRAGQHAIAHSAHVEAVGPSDPGTGCAHDPPGDARTRSTRTGLAPCPGDGAECHQRLDGARSRRGLQPSAAPLSAGRRDGIALFCALGLRDFSFCARRAADIASAGRTAAHSCSAAPGAGVFPGRPLYAGRCPHCSRGVSSSPRPLGADLRTV